MKTLKKIVIAPDSFKESLSATEVANAIEKGFRCIYPNAEYVKLPMADGGEGTVDAMVDATAGSIIRLLVTGPLGEPVDAFYGLMGGGKTAVIEMSAASGIRLVPIENRNPLITTSYGTGELILNALDKGVQSIIIGIGGSATNDGGAGMLQALGIKLLDKNKQTIANGGAALINLTEIDFSALDKRLLQVKITVACDVDNPLCGTRGASAVFGPQKGATPEMVKELDAALYHFGSLLEKATGQAVLSAAGAGAAGGMGAALLGALNAQLMPGVSIVSEALQLDKAVQGADLVITGEGRIDGQTIFGKTPIGVTRVAKQYNIPVIGIAGSLGDNFQVVHEHGIDAVFSVLNRITTLEEALSNAYSNIEMTARSVASVWKLAETKLQIDS